MTPGSYPVGEVSQSGVAYALQILEHVLGMWGQANPTGEKHVNRCKAELMMFRGDRKTEERTRAQQHLQVPITLDQILDEIGTTLFQYSSVEDLQAVSDTYRHRMSDRQFSRFVNLMVDCYGTPFARHAGLPVGRPRLSLAS